MLLESELSGVYFEEEFKALLRPDFSSSEILLVSASGSMVYVLSLLLQLLCCLSLPLSVNFDSRFGDKTESSDLELRNVYVLVDEWLLSNESFPGGDIIP